VPLDIDGGGQLEPIIELLGEAGALLLERLAQPRSIEKKGFRDLVTDADYCSEKLILSRIQQLHPDDGILSEEAGGSVPSTGRCWIVDPLDGTTNYSHRHPLFSVSAALVDDLGPSAAVTHAPVLATTWYALRDGGAWSIDPGGNIERLTLGSGTDLGECLLATGFSYQRKELDHGALDVFENLLREAQEIRRGGSACLDLAFTAAGIFQGFWEFHLAPHDVAAGALLVQEAGGIVTDGEGRQDWLHGGSIVAASAQLHPRLLEVVAPAMPPRDDSDE